MGEKQQGRKRHQVEKGLALEPPGKTCSTDAGQDESGESGQNDEPVNAFDLCTPQTLLLREPLLEGRADRDREEGDDGENEGRHAESIRREQPGEHGRHTHLQQEPHHGLTCGEANPVPHALRVQGFHDGMLSRCDVVGAADGFVAIGHQPGGAT